MRKPSFQQPRSTSMPFSLSRNLAKFRMPAAPPPKPGPPRPRVGKPARSAVPKRGK